MLVVNTPGEMMLRRKRDVSDPVSLDDASLEVTNGDFTMTIDDEISAATKAEDIGRSGKPKKSGVTESEVKQDVTIQTSDAPGSQFEVQVKGEPFFAMK